MNSKLSAYCLSVQSFFEHVPWDGTSAESVEGGSIGTGHASTSEELKWQCMSITQFFNEMAWDRRKQALTADFCEISVIKPLAMPVGRFFREFGQQASRKISA
ncbi:MAG: hypothetical protein AB4050_16395 [Synechococcus sp.]